jgi:membrane associated rhomboid family serine protease
MVAVSSWVRRRRWTLGLALFFVSWYILQLGVFQLFGEDFAQWLFYFELPVDEVSPGIVLAPISHDMVNLTHLCGNLVFLIIAGGLSEPYIGKTRILVLVFGLGYLGLYIANATAVFHHLWMIAGASGGILSLWAYAGLRIRHQAVGNLSEGLTWSRQSVETITGMLLLLGIPAFLIHQTLVIDQPHSGHLIGLFLGCLYYGGEVYLGHTDLTNSGNTKHQS